MISFVCLVATLFLAASSIHQVYSKTPNTYSLTKPNLSKVPANTLLKDIPFTLVQTGGGLDSPEAKIRITITNKPEGSDVEFKKQNSDGSLYDVVNDDYSTDNSFVIPANIYRTDLYSIKFSTAGDYTLNYSLIDLNEANPYIVNENVAVSVVPGLPRENTPDANGLATLDVDNPQVIIRSASKPVIITVNSDVTNPTLNFGSLITSGSGVLPKTTINTSTNIVEIPATTTVTSVDSGWDGIMKAPILVSVVLPDIEGMVRTAAEAIEIGTSNTLSFDRAVKLTFVGKTGLKAGFMKAGALELINTECTADDSTAGDALVAGGDCYVDTGSDLVVWTKHFTTFVVYTSSVVPTPSGSLNGDSSTSTPVLDPNPTPLSEPSSPTPPVATSTDSGSGDNASSTATSSTPIFESSTTPSDSSSAANANSSGAPYTSLAVIVGLFLVLGTILWAFLKRS